MDIYSKTTNHLRNALKDAYTLAVQLQQSKVQPEHLLFGLSKQKGSIGYEILQKIEITSDILKKRIIASSKKPKKKADIAAMELSPIAQKIFEKGFLLAYKHKHHYVGTEHILAALINDWKDVGDFLSLGDAAMTRLMQHVQTVMKSTSKFPELTSNFKSQSETTDAQEDKPAEMSLEYFTVDLTEAQRQKTIDPVIGREKEIERIIQILSRRYKNNPVLLGDPGVGKTAIVEGLAKKIAAGEVPEVLRDKKILTLDLSAVLAGSIYRGEFESRIKQIIDEIKEKKDVILFIDEIHNIVGAGSVNGSLDAANMLKPALARGEINCIGATTFDEYKKYIQTDKALERRFQAISVMEPTPEQTKTIIQGIKQQYEQFHGVQIDTAAINSAVALSVQHLPLKKLPDKAIDILDESAAYIKMKRPLSTTEKQIKRTQQAVSKTQEEKIKSVKEERYDRAIFWKEKEQQLQRQLTDFKEKYEIEKSQNNQQVTEDVIKRVLAHQTGIPVDEIEKTQHDRLSDLEKNLKQAIIGQDAALERITKIIKRRQLYAKTRAHQPIASFVFIGPSGVGKTETAKVLAKHVYGNQDALIRIDMSEYSEKFNISKLIGSPAGYVGYNESGVLSEQLQKRPHSVVLFDEIEKAHPDIFNLLLQILDNGFLTDATGKTLSFQNTIILLTSNIGSKIDATKPLGFSIIDATDNSQAVSDMKRDHEKELREFLRPELLNRFDEVLFFSPLQKEHFTQIIRQKIKALTQTLKQEGILLSVSQKTQELLTEKSIDPQKGARNIESVIQNMIEDAVADLMLENKKSDTIKISAKAKNKQIEWQIQ